MLTIKNGKIATEHIAFELPDGFQICTEPINYNIGMKFQKDDDIYLSVFDDVYYTEFCTGSIPDDIRYIQEDGFYDLIECPTEVERNGKKGWSCVYRTKDGNCEYYEERYLHKGEEGDHETEIVLSTIISEEGRRKSVKELFNEPCVERFLSSIELK